MRTWVARRWTRLVLPAVVAGLIVGASVAAAGTVFVSAKVSDNGRVHDLLSGSFKQTVTCVKACRLNTEVGIQPKIARRLGFSGIKAGEPWFWIATSKGTLKAKTPTRLGFVLTPQAKKLLPHAKTGFQILGLVKAVVSQNSSKQASITWITTLK
jgi:hypothetical protein